MKITTMVGYKLFKEKEDGSLHMIRITFVKRVIGGISKTEPTEMQIYDYDDGVTKTVKISDYKDYTPLKPDGIFTISVATVLDSAGKENKDVIATFTHYDSLKSGRNMMPYAVCRQNISDVFYNLITQTPDKQLVGVAISQDTCPSNFDFGIMFAADSIGYNEFINFYRTDTLEDLYNLINVKVYDDVLRNSFLRHVKATGDMSKSFLNEDSGWCKDLKTLLEINNFQNDMDMMLGITSVDFNINDFVEVKKLEEKDIEYKVCNDDFRDWLSYQYKAPIVEADIMEYDHDVDLEAFKKASYILMRDNTKTLYVIVYRTEGEFFEEDLRRKAESPDFSTKFKLKYYNKYNQYNNGIDNNISVEN